MHHANTHTQTNTQYVLPSAAPTTEPRKCSLTGMCKAQSQARNKQHICAAHISALAQHLTGIGA